MHTKHLLNNNWIIQEKTVLYNIISITRNKSISAITDIDYALAGAVVNAACLESRRSWARTPLWSSSSKETKCFFPAHS